MRRQKYFWFLESGLAVCLLASVFVALIALSTPVFAENLASTSTSEVVQLKLDHLAEAHKNDVDALNKRIDDALTTTGQGVDRFGVIMGWGGVLVTVLLFIIGIWGYLAAGYKAKVEAREVAETWFKDNTQKLEAEIEALRAKVAQAHDSMHQTVKGVEDHAEAAKSAISRRQLDIEQSHDNRSSSTHSDDKDDETLRLRDQELQQKSESTYSFDDWNARAHAAYASNKLTDAVYFWGRALQVEGAGAVETAKALLNKGVAQGDMGNHMGAMESFDEVIRCYGDVPEVSLREPVAKALLNKGIAQGNMSNHTGAVEGFDEVIRRYGDALEITLQESVAKALFNKGIAQGNMSNHTGAIASYDEVICRYGDALEVSLREQAALALLNKGVAQSQMDDHTGAMKSFDEVISRYSNALDAALWKVVAHAQLQKERLANDTGA